MESEISIEKKPDEIIVCGMGGSAIGGQLLKDWLDYLPIAVCREYGVPSYAGERTLVMAVSYSGNTEETLCATLDAMKRGCKVVVVTSGGLLKKICEKRNIPMVQIPQGLQPRAAVPYLFFPLAVVLQRAGLVSDISGEIENAITALEQVRDKIKPAVPAKKNPSKKLALAMKGAVPIVCGHGHYESVAMRIKSQFNENSKTPSFWEVFPELNHNATVGWTGNEKLTKNFALVLLRDKNEPEMIRTRIDATRKLVLDKKAKKVVELYGDGGSKLARMLSAMYIGDFASIYLAVLYGVDPTPVDVITELKNILESRTETKNKIISEIDSL